MVFEMQSYGGDEGTEESTTGRQRAEV
jgi:hypothetical protein